MLAKRIQNLHPYVPGEQPKDREYIKLNANENPYPPHESVAEALSKAALTSTARIGLYPDPDSNELRSAIADMLNSTGGVFCTSDVSGQKCTPSAKDKIPFEVTPDMIFCGNGSDEVLSFVFYTFFDGDRPLVMPEFTYSFYPVYCGYYGIPMCTVPLKTDWQLDREAMLSAANKTDSAIIFANPNAPT
ncbi:MAG: aminotransferase class I/II-fold pyridoxal phosphate-dependent enzyme, partial [Treponema sp.]|nr:aminotransferase class I/II-fold pyridoxal phosphate-dependent enzyme [Treponema sp.]